MSAHVGLAFCYGSEGDFFENGQRGFPTRTFVRVGRGGKFCLSPVQVRLGPRGLRGVWCVHDGSREFLSPAFGRGGSWSRAHRTLLLPLVFAGPRHEDLLGSAPLLYAWARVAQGQEMSAPVRLSAPSCMLGLVSPVNLTCTAPKLSHTTHIHTHTHTHTGNRHTSGSQSVWW